MLLISIIQYACEINSCSKRFISGWKHFHNLQSYFIKMAMIFINLQTSNFIGQFTTTIVE